MPDFEDQLAEAFVLNAIDFVCDSAFLHLKGCGDVALSRMSDAGRELWIEFVHLTDIVLAARVNRFKAGQAYSETLSLVYAMVWDLVTD